MSNKLLLTVWDKAVGTDTYIKSEWRDLQQAIQMLERHTEHGSGCKAHSASGRDGPDDSECDCGLTDAKKELNVE